MVVVDKKKRSCKIIDFAVPGVSILRRRRKIRSKNIKSWEGSYRRCGMFK